ncbi:ATP-binding protein [uncultured Algimonas sp.]|uniref:ATP-binding protein n=1 Tax=uncultured Algimonas sp. TaxID=1547920 RepID=UPI0026113B0D|nr:ATP-binding protein [uncultured Algimonas sp.]
MNEAIPSSPSSGPVGRMAGWSGLVILILLVIIGSIWAALAWTGLQPGPQILVAGVIALAVLLAAGLLITMRAGSREDRRAAHRDSLYSEAFFLSGRPQLITRNGEPAHANRAYLDIARTLAVDVLPDTLPSVDRLFSTTGKDGSAAIFRLHNIPPTQSEAEEEINLVMPNGTLSRFRISVKRIGAQPGLDLWQIDEIAGMESHGASLANAPIGLFSLTRDGRVISINTTMQRWLGGPDAVAPTHINEFIEDPLLLLDADAVHGKTVRADTRLITRKGVVTPIVMIARWNAVEAGDLVASVALHGHTSRPGGQRQTELSQAAGSDKQHAPAFASVPFGVLQVDGANIGTAKITYTNKAFRTLWGGGDPIGQPFASLFDGHTVRKTLAGKSVADMGDMGAIDVRLTGAGKVPVALYIVPDPVLPERLWAYLVDISTRKSLEEQVRQSQKMQAVGQLTAGVAHDFNNLLTAIRLNTDELLQRHPVGDPSYPELQNINATGARAAALVKKLLAFSRQQTRRAERIDISEVLSDMYLTLKQTLGGQAQLELSHARDLPPVMMDRSQFDNVVMNLCVNARDAMEAQGGGRITIESERLSRHSVTDLGLQSALMDFPSDDIVLISVSDTGTGMTEAVKAKIFEPFFTTKDQGKGTGLGLATVYGIIQQSGGHLEVDSELGRGTTFNIYLPAAPELTQQDIIDKAPAPAERKPADLAGQGNILFVEDEAAVRVIAAKSLRKRGYNVVEAEDGEEALELLEGASEPFDLLLSDVVMPGLDGPGLLKQGREMLGDARIVFISGYAEEKFSDLLAEEPDVTFLPKPFTLAELAEKVKSEIGEAVG